MAEEDGNVSQQIIDYQVARVKGGCGLNMSEVCSVHKASAPKGFLAIHSDSLIESHKKFTEAIHNAGGKCGVQLWQGSLASSLDPNAEILVADDFKYGKYTIPKISVEKIKEVVDSFGEAARRSVEAGYDCIGFHCGHNYLPHSFLTAGMNNSVEKIKEVVDSFGEAARRSVEAGYDCIGFHCGHNYLPHSFLTAGMNNRDDEYGGSNCRYE